MSEATTVSTAVTSTDHAPATNRAKIRQALLFTLLGVMVFALWYDYKVARPAVDKAYTDIARLNDKINGSARSSMTNVDVQQALGRAPTDVFIHGPHTIECYGWPAGLPIDLDQLVSENPTVGLRTHDYYAVYMRLGNDLVFRMHFKNYLDTELLDGRAHSRPRRAGAAALQEEFIGDFLTPEAPDSEPTFADRGRPQRPPLETQESDDASDAPASDD